MKILLLPRRFRCGIAGGPAFDGRHSSGERIKIGSSCKAQDVCKAILWPHRIVLSGSFSSDGEKEPEEEVTIKLVVHDQERQDDDDELGQ